MKLFDRLLRRRKAPAPAPARYRIGDVEITLPPGHALPRFQAAFPLYDRFLLTIGREAIDGWVIDIGANVGDSAAALVSGPPKRIVCVEPHAPFLRNLEQNIPDLEVGGSKIVVAPFAISRNAASVTLSATESTAHRADGAGVDAISTRTLDALAQEYCGGERVDFIKCDVDGFDGDALLSGMDMIRRFKPAIFFECVANAETIESYVDLAAALFDLGYNIKAFDNFGLPLMDVKDRAAFQELMLYVLNVATAKSAQTLYYVDCLAYMPDSTLATTALSAYLEQFDIDLPRRPV